MIKMSSVAFLYNYFMYTNKFFFVQELVVAFAGLVVHFETQFAAVAAQMVEEDRLRPQPAVLTREVSGGWNLVSTGSQGRPV